MKLSSLALGFFLAVLTAAPSESAPAGAPPLRFEKVPLGNVVLILSARFGAPVTINANARTPITGDFSGVGLGAALAAASRQAGLVVRALGPDPAAGYVLELPPPPPSADEVARGLQAAARRRAELLQQRTALLQQASP
jgi:hypothetical protein